MVLSSTSFFNQHISWQSNGLSEELWCKSSVNGLGVFSNNTEPNFLNWFPPKFKCFKLYNPQNALLSISDILLLSINNVCRLVRLVNAPSWTFVIWLWPSPSFCRLTRLVKASSGISEIRLPLSHSFCRLPRPVNAPSEITDIWLLCRFNVCRFLRPLNASLWISDIWLPHMSRNSRLLRPENAFPSITEMLFLFISSFCTEWDEWMSWDRDD